MEGMRCLCPIEGRGGLFSPRNFAGEMWLPLPPLFHFAAADFHITTSLHELASMLSNAGIWLGVVGKEGLGVRWFCV